LANCVYANGVSVFDDSNVVESEAATRDPNVVLAPVMDAARDARGACTRFWERNPYLVTAMRVAFTRVQGNDLREGVLANAKHYPGSRFRWVGSAKLLMSDPRHRCVNSL